MPIENPSDRHQWPNNVGQKRTLEAVDGKPMLCTIEDEILHPQTGSPEKLICFQQLRCDNGACELRMTQYVLGVGKYWVWGQSSSNIPAGDFEEIAKEAQARGWFVPG
jgi:hypothetical protein